MEACCDPLMKQDFIQRKKKNVWSQGEKKIKNGGFKAAFASAFVEIKACPPVLCAY